MPSEKDKLGRLPIPVFVLGSGRSGTTVTASMLNRIPGVHIAKETGYISQCVELLQKIEHSESQGTLVRIVNSWLEAERWTGRASIDGFAAFCRQHQLRGASAFIRYVWQLDTPTPCNELHVIGDNTPLYVLSIPWLLQLFPDARFVHVVRDPRDVVCSIISMRFGADDPVVAAMEWQNALGCWLMAERMIPPQHRIEIRYEDLCLTPELTFRRLSDWLRSSVPEMSYMNHIDFAMNAAQGTFESVSELPHHQRLQAPLNSSRIGRYRTELSEQDIARVEAVVQNGMLACGYPLSQWQVSPYAKEDRFAQTSAMLRNLLIRGIKKLTKSPREDLRQQSNRPK